MAHLGKRGTFFRRVAFQQIQILRKRLHLKHFNPFDMSTIVIPDHIFIIQS